MIRRPFAAIRGLGVAVPERVVTNADFEKTLETSDQWIVERTGIRERRWAEPGLTAAELARRASVQALARRGSPLATSAPSSSPPPPPTVSSRAPPATCRRSSARARPPPST
jgi:3-oxoacyl-[acyl-carrier-protein] synthase-3